MDKPPAPLAGLKVVELARILAGPWIGQTLADLGADVVKIESPEGDDTRRWGPPFVQDAHGADIDAAYFHACNRGKRSVIADLRTPGAARLQRDWRKAQMYSSKISKSVACRNTGWITQDCTSSIPALCIAR